MKLKLRGDSASSDIEKAIRNRFNLPAHQPLVLVDEEGFDVVLDHTLTTGVYTLNGAEHKERSYTIAVVGASGNIGAATLTHLSKLYGSKHRILAVTRDSKSDKSKALSSLPGVTVVEGTLNNTEALTGVLKGVDHALIVTPGDENRTNLAINGINAAKAAGVHFIAVISVSTVANAPESLFARQFKPIEDHIKKVGVPHAIIRLPIFIDNYWGHKPSIASQGHIYAPVRPDAKHSQISTADAGFASALILASPSRHHGAVYNFAHKGFTNADVAAAFSEALGKEVKYVHVPYEAARAAMSGMGFPAWQITGIEELYHLCDDGNYLYSDADFRSVTGREPTSIEHWVQAVASNFK